MKATAGASTLHSAAAEPDAVQGDLGHRGVTLADLAQAPLGIATRYMVGGGAQGGLDPLAGFALGPEAGGRLAGGRVVAVEHDRWFL